MGGLGLRPWEIERLTNEDIKFYVKGFLKFRKENLMIAFEANRLSGFLAIAPHLPKHYKKPTQVIKFDWEGENNVFSEKTSYSPHIQEQILIADEKDIRSGLLKPGTPAYDEAVDRLKKAGLWLQ